MQTYVIFSAFGKATDYPILQSLKNRGDLKIICITARIYKRGWKNKSILTHDTFFNPMSKFSRIVRHFIRYDSIKSEKITKFILKTRFFRNIFVIPHNLRHFLALEVLKKIEPNDYVFLVDARDLIFQTSPVDIAEKLSTSNTVELHDEGKVYWRNGLTQNFHFSKVNLEWVNQLLNFSTVPITFDMSNTIINAGCISGHSRNLITILEHTSNLLSSSQYGIATILDQAAVNVAAYNKPEFRSLFHINDNGSTVLNMCGIVDAGFSLVNGNILLNNLIVPIIHQFDRYGSYSSKNGLKMDRRDYGFIHNYDI